MLVSKRNQRSAEMAALMGDLDAQLAGMRDSFVPGEKVRGTVLSVGAASVTLDIGAKMNGVVDLAQFGEELFAAAEFFDIITN